jgi:hypothetical protein
MREKEKRQPLRPVNLFAKKSITYVKANTARDLPSRPSRLVYRKLVALV